MRRDETPIPDKELDDLDRLLVRVSDEMRRSDAEDPELKAMVDRIQARIFPELVQPQECICEAELVRACPVHNRFFAPSTDKSPSNPR